MTSLFQMLRNSLTKIERGDNENPAPVTSATNSRYVDLDLAIEPDDPIHAFFQVSPGAVGIDKLPQDSPALQQLKKSGARFVVPLISQGELIGMLNLGSRLSEQEYSLDDQRLLNNLASQAAPALRVAQLVQQQQQEARKRERLEQELRVARIIQETLLPKKIPEFPGWRASAYWQPARAVGGDFYDFIELPDGHLGLVIGDVTDKGVPAALVMATTRSILRSAAERIIAPGQVLARINNLLCGDIPRNMFVTCLYAILDLESGVLRYANAGHNLPFRNRGGNVDELRATGMPLGLLPQMEYEESETNLQPGDSVLFYSDGLVEAHNPNREMFSFDRLRSLMQINSGGDRLVKSLLTELSQFTGEDWEQEDDVTFVTLERMGNNYENKSTLEQSSITTGEHDLKSVLEFQLPSEPGRERQAMEKVAEGVAGLGLSAARLDRLKTAVAEATMNAMEHGNHYRAEIPTTIQVLVSEDALIVRISDQGGNKIPEKETPDLEAKLAGLQSPRGWGLFLIKNMADDMHLVSGSDHHTIELVFFLKGGQDGS